MKEKELRLALVYYGGVSLAIYQHGVNVEILNLIRASSAYHAPRSFARKQAPDHTYSDHAAADGTASSEAVYFDLLKAIGRSFDLRVIVDVLSGSSAGGINAIVLARALVHDLEIAPLTQMWLDKADILQLIATEARAGKWSKWYLSPFMRLLFGRLAREGVLPAQTDAETLARISTFLRSRWFKPPFDGPHFSELLLDGLLAMTPSGTGEATLLPPAVRLDLIITVTDYHGAEQVIFMHDPALIREREHRQLLHFSATRSSQGLAHSDFELTDVPALAFAGRASASYPGAFPPAQIAEMDKIVANRGLLWPDREQFLADNFSHYSQIGLRPEEIVLLDGSILNNKPLLAAITALRRHNAYREVDRRLVYIDPHSERPNAALAIRVPGFFSTLRGALSDLPRHNPIFEELEETNRYNAQTRRLKALVRITRPQVEAMIDALTEGGLTGEITTAKLRHWRLTSTSHLASTALVYNAWMRALVLEAVDVIASLLARVCRFEPRSHQAQWLRAVVESWSEIEGMFPENYHIPVTVQTDADLPPFARFIVNFGVKYKARRISFVLQQTNRAYELTDDSTSTSPILENLDTLKRQVNDCLRSIYMTEDKAFIENFPQTEIRTVFCSEPAPLVVRPDHFATIHRYALGTMFAKIGALCGLVGTNDELDEILSSPLLTTMPAQLRRIILAGYLGWPHWDVILLPAMNALGLDNSALEDVLVDRISPTDATTVCTDDGCGKLQGEAAVGFGGFFSRKARENDYLWGRIHAIDRLIDIVAGAIDSNADEMRPDFLAFKKRAFQAVLHQESDRLTHIPDIVTAIRAAVDKL